MTGRARRGWICAALLLALLTIIATFPMRLALEWAGADPSGFAARRIAGSIWSAQIGDARMGTLPLGDLDAWLVPGPLLSGRAEIGFSRQAASLDRLSGRLRAGSVRGVTRLGGSVPIFANLGLMPVDTVRLEDVEVLFDTKGRCRSAHGRVQLLVGGPIAGLDLSQGFSGTLACRDDHTEAILLSQSGMEKIALTFDGKGAYQARLAIRVEGDAAMAAALTALGFRAASDGFAVVASGRF